VQKKLESVTSPQLDAWLQHTVDAARVKLNPKFGSFSKAGGSPAVIPPGAPPGLLGPSTSPSSPTSPASPGAPPSPGGDAGAAPPD
jgi:hypothetical protein